MSINPYVATAGYVDSIIFEQLELPGKQIVTSPIVILAGQNLNAGAVIGKITSSGKWVLSASAAGDGSEVPRGIMREAVNCVDKTGTAQDKTMTCAVEGNFNEGAIYFGAGHTVESLRSALNDRGIHLRRVGYSG